MSFSQKKGSQPAAAAAGDVFPSKKFVKINPKKLRQKEKISLVGEKSRWIVKGSEDLSSDDDDEGIESASASLRRDITSQYSNVGCCCCCCCCFHRRFVRARARKSYFVRRNAQKC